MFRFAIPSVSWPKRGQAAGGVKSHGHAWSDAASTSRSKPAVFALLGPNGGGKTTLLRTLLGLLPPRAGEVRIGERSLTDISARERARLIAYVPQTHVATFAFTVETVVLMARTAHGNLFSRPTAKNRVVVANVLERFGIAQLAQRPYTMVSGGERQLALLARALAQEPQFVVLDEPTASLDFGNQGKVMNEMRALARLRPRRALHHQRPEPGAACRGPRGALARRYPHRQWRGRRGAQPRPARSALPGARGHANRHRERKNGVSAGVTSPLSCQRKRHGRGLLAAAFADDDNFR